MPRRTLPIELGMAASRVGGIGAGEFIKGIPGHSSQVGEIAFRMAPIASGVLTGASFPPFQTGFLAWFALVPLLVALRRKNMLSAVISAWLFGCTYAVCSFFWINSVTSVNVASFMIMVGLFSLYFPVFAFFYVLLNRAIGPWMIFGTPALWVTIEYVRSNFFFLSLPWNLMGHSQYGHAVIIQVADIAGVYGISFLIVMVNELLGRIPDVPQWRMRDQSAWADACLSTRMWKSQFVSTALVLAAVLLYGSWRLNDSKADAYIRVGLVQTGVPVRLVVKRAEQESILNAFGKLTREAVRENPELIVWPASSLPAPITVNSFVRENVQQLAVQARAYLVVGSAGFEKFKPLKQGARPYSCSEFVVSPLGHIDGPYNKIRLLPFDEYIPLQGLIDWPLWITSLKEGFLPGDNLKLFQAGPARFGTPICWENVFPDFFRQFVANGANLMISVTNEEFMARSRAQYQSLAINVFRAVENRVSVIRASSVGVSALIDPTGRIVERIQDEARHDLFVSGFFVRDVPLAFRKSFYTRHGDAFAFLVICGAAILLLAALRGAPLPGAFFR